MDLNNPPVQDEHREDQVPLLKKLGPGLITGAADDDPSGIVTYSQAGAQYGYSLLWSVLFTTPLMIGIQIVSARIGRVTGDGIAANIREHFPRPLLYFIVSLLLIANNDQHCRGPWRDGRRPGPDRRRPERNL